MVEKKKTFNNAEEEGKKHKRKDIQRAADLKRKRTFDEKWKDGRQWKKMKLGLRCFALGAENTWARDPMPTRVPSLEVSFIYVN